jgi:sulfatase maturation enzyme AslB (radical SAM superfamily)
MITEPYSPKGYLDSIETKQLQQDFIDGKQPEKCNGCWIKERNGSKSIRSYFAEPRDLTKITHLELRESNLCNFSCRMCNASDSVVIDKEVKSNPELQAFFSINHDKPTTKENWDEILELVKGVTSINLTGGEPMLMKRYYDFLDYLIDIGKNSIRLTVYTNGSVYNSIFVEKLLKFPNATLSFSIDATGKIAEYQRRGTVWGTVRNNIIRYMELPISIKLHSTITAYSILGVSDLADFFVELNETKRKAMLRGFTANILRSPKALEFTNLNLELRVRAIRQIDTAIEKLSDQLFETYVKELKSARNQLITRKECNFSLLVNMTKTLDKVRNESFEDTFGYKI